MDPPFVRLIPTMGLPKTHKGGFFLRLHSSPFSPGYWHDALASFKNLRVQVFSALMIAACVVLSYVPGIYITEGVRVGWGFLARATCALVGGPINALVFGAAEDTISFLLNPKGPYFPGYVLTTMLGTFLYALFFYRAKITILRVFLAKLTNNVVNVFLQSLWSAILYDEGYRFFLVAKAGTNAIMLPVQVVMLVVLFAALLPILYRMGLLPDQAMKLPKREKSV